MARPRLTVCLIVANAEKRLEHWIARTLEFADELVIAVDDISADATLAIARSYADDCFVFAHAPVIEQVMDYCVRRATGEWILYLDDDEFMHRDFPSAIDGPLAEPTVTHYWLPYRWLNEDGGRIGWLRTFPWHPNPRLRLLRNIGGLFFHDGRIHKDFTVAGEGGVLEGDEFAVWHTDFLIRDRAAREAKVERYRAEKGPSCEEYYLWEDADFRPLEPFDVAAVLREPLERGLERASLRREESRGENVEPDYVSASVLEQCWRRHRPEADIFHAEYLDHKTPAVLPANNGRTVEVTLRNTSAFPWRTTGAAPGRVMLSYHWEHVDHGTVLRDGDASQLPAIVRPGEMVTIEAGLWAPSDPGRYDLVWDLRARDVSWFSDRGVPPLRVPVEISSSGARSAHPREAAALPPRAKAGPRSLKSEARRFSGIARAMVRRGREVSKLTAANVVPMSPERVLDTRDGSGVPGAPIGPIASGQAVVLSLAGQHGIPSYAVGFVGTLSVLEATYNGFASVRPDDGGGDVIAGYFTDRGDPSAFTIVPGLSSEGAVSIRLSDNWPGSAQLLLDVFAYVG